MSRSITGSVTLGGLSGVPVEIWDAARFGGVFPNRPGFPPPAGLPDATGVSGSSSGHFGGYKVDGCPDGDCWGAFLVNGVRQWAEFPAGGAADTGDFVWPGTAAGDQVVAGGGGTDLARTGTALASDGSTAANAIDGDETTDWRPGAPGTNPEWLRVDLGTAQVVGSVRVHGSWALAPTSGFWQLEYSDNGSAWTLAVDRTTLAQFISGGVQTWTPYDTAEVPTGITAPHRYWRIYSAAIGQYEIVYSFNLFASVAGAPTRVPVGAPGSFWQVDATTGLPVWGAAPSGGGGGSTTLAGDTDVNITSPANSEVLTYDSASSKWKNAAAPGGGGGSGNVDTGSTFTSAIHIPGLAGSPDIVAAGGNDDEFDENANAVPTGWTAFNSPASVRTDLVKSHLYIKGTSNGGNDKPQGVLKAAPSIPYTVTAKLSGAAPEGVQYGRVAMWIMDGTTSGPLLWLEGTEGSGGDGWAVTNTSSWSTSISGYSAHFDFGSGLLRTPIYLRAIVTAANNIKVQMSYNGRLWTTLQSGISVLSAATHVGLGVSPYSQDTEVIFDWIRFS